MGVNESLTFEIKSGTPIYPSATIKGYQWQEQLAGVPPDPDGWGVSSTDKKRSFSFASPNSRIVYGRMLDINNVGTFPIAIPVEVLDLPSETEYTASIWFKTKDANCGIFSVGAGVLGDGGHDRHIYLKGGNIYVCVHSNEVINTPSVNYADGNWHHVAHVYGKSIGGQKIYIDGVEKASGPKSSSDFDWQTGINIGYSNDASNKYFSGMEL